MSSLRVRLLGVVLLSVFPLAHTAAEDALAERGRWTQVKDDEGIRVWELEIPGKELPGFRGQAYINAAPAEIMRAIERVEEHPQWMHRCSDARVLERTDPERAVVYNRTDSPWPAWDRDVVLDTLITRSEDGRRMVLTFQATDATSFPVPDGVIRMPRLEGSYVLVGQADGRTLVTYQIEVDIGGSIPTWIAKRLARDMPFETLKRLRERAQGKLAQE